MQDIIHLPRPVTGDCLMRVAHTVLTCDEESRAWRMQDGAPGEIRTPDPQVRSLMLYPTELRALLNFAHHADGLGGLLL